MQARSGSLFAGLLCCALLAGCGSAPVQRDRPVRETVASFAFNGRLGVTLGDRAHSMRISWEHTPRQDQIGFSSPLGSQLALLRRNAAGASWETGDGERVEAASADELIARLADFPVPVDALVLWVRGRISAAALKPEFDPLGRLAAASDQGWQVRMVSYESDLPNALPRIIEARQGEMKVRLAIEEWML
jgi:outer membrane lipoprotein LolB